MVGDVVALHKSIEEFRDAGVELVLKTECVWIKKTVHILRAAGDRLAGAELGNWDKNMRASLSRSLSGSSAATSGGKLWMAVGRAVSVGERWLPRPSLHSWPLEWLLGQQ